MKTKIEIKRKINMCKKIFILFLMLTIHSITHSQSTKLEGTWEGKTSQDYNMSIKVQMVDGSPMITRCDYEIKLQATSWSKVRKWIDFNKIKIIEGKFIYSNSMAGIFSDEISGMFKGNTVKGSISKSVKYYVDKGKGTANVTFTLKKTDSIK